MKLATKIFKRDDWYVTSNYGSRNPISTKKGITNNFHNGCDYGTNGQKWPQYALENGTIISCGIDADGGKYIWIEYPRIHKKILHYHLDKICIIKGQTVNENTLLGYTGDTGKATGIHLHLGMIDINTNNYEDPDSFEYIPINSLIDQEDSKKRIKTISDNIKELINTGFKTTEIQQIINNILLDVSDVYINYTVVSGDTLYKIGKKFGVQWQKIYKNNINVIGDNPNLIIPGQILKISI